MSLQLHPWRDVDGRLDPGFASVWQACGDDAELRRARERLPAAGTAIELEVDAPDRLPGLEFRPRNPSEFALRSWTPVDDRDLLALAAELAPPAAVLDAELGTLTFNPRLCWYEREPTRAANYRLHITPEDARTPGPSVERARAMVRWVESHADAIRRGAGDALWTLWDSTWRQDDEHDVDRETFESRLTIRTVSWRPDHGDGDIVVHLDDGGLFGGHQIEVEIVGRAIRSARI